MKKILIADSSKASMVMISEIFKDNFPGIQVVVAASSEEVLQKSKDNKDLDVFVIDFHLPDKNGAVTASKLKALYNKPILITAFETEGVQETIQKELIGYDDCLNWLHKPVQSSLLVSIAKRYTENLFRCQRRIDTQLPAEIVYFNGKDIKKSLNLKAVISDSSNGGIKISLDKDYLKEKKVTAKQIKEMKMGQLIQVFCPPLDKVSTRTISLKNKISTKTPDVFSMDTKIIWFEDNGTSLLFGLEATQKKLSERFFKSVLAGEKLLLVESKPKKSSTLTAISSKKKAAGS